MVDFDSNKHYNNSKVHKAQAVKALELAKKVEGKQLASGAKWITEGKTRRLVK